MKPNWNSLAVSIAVGIIGAVALLTGQQQAALACIGALAGILTPPPYSPS